MKFRNKLKTVASVALAMSVGTTMLPLSVSAEAEPYASTKYYNSCDINRDGEVDIMDAILFNRCMVGADYISDFKQLDADTNGIVNFADAECILCYLVGSSYTCSVDGLWGGYTYQTISDTPSPISAPTSAEYVKYDYTTKKTSTYTLSMPEEYNAENAISTYDAGIIGDDDREYMTDQPEFTGIVDIRLGSQDYSGQSNGTAMATGFIVGDHQIATAAHCVYDKYLGKSDYYFLQNPNTKDQFYLYDKDGHYLTGERLTPVEVHIPKEYYSNVSKVGQSKLIDCDYALITVEEDLSKYTHFNLGLTKDPYSSTFSNADIYISGMPLKIGSEYNIIVRRIAKGVGKIYTGVQNNRDTILYCTTDATEGDSGAPIYTVTRYKTGNTEYYDYTAIGIVKGGTDNYNCGARVIPIMQRFYQSNPNITY